MNYLIILLRDELLKKYREDFSNTDTYINWTDARCEEFAEFIQETIKPFFSEEAISSLEFTVSEGTIQRIMKRLFQLKSDPHWRTIKVLNNICVYIKYKSWAHFVKAKYDRVEIHCNSAKHISGHEKALAFLHQARQAEFDTYKTVPNIDLEKFKPYHYEHDSTYHRVVSLTNKMLQAGLVINNVNNPSTYTINSVDIVYETDFYQFATNEYWYLNWFNQTTNKYEYYFSLLINCWFQLDKNNFKIFQSFILPVNDRDAKYVDEIYGPGNIFEKELPSSKNIIRTIF